MTPAPGWLLPERPGTGARPILMNGMAACLFLLLISLTFLENSRLPRVLLTGLPLLIGAWGLRRGWLSLEPVRPFLLPVGGLYFVLLASAAFSIDAAYSLKTFANQHLWFPLFFLLIGTWAVTPERQRLLLRGLMAAGGISAVLGILYYFFAEAMEDTRWVRRVEYYVFEARDEDGAVYHRAQGMLWSYTRSALVFVFALPATVALGLRAWRGGRAVETGLAVAVALLATWFLLLTKSRGVWMGVALACLLTWVWMRGTWLVPLLGALAFGLLLAALPAQRSRAMTFVDHFSDPDLMMSGRIDLWSRGLAPIRENLLLGVGYGGNIFQTPAAVERYPLLKHDRQGAAASPAPDDLQSDLHNMYIQTLAETGLAGVLMYGWLLALLLAAGGRALRAERARPRLDGVIPMYAAFLACLLIGVVYYFNEEHFAQMLWGMSGVLVASAWVHTQPGRDGAG